MTIKKQAFTMALLPPPPTPGEAQFVTNSTTAVYSWTVPENVYRISAVCVACPDRSGGLGQAYPKVSRGATVLLAPDKPLGIDGVGGGNAGTNGPGGSYSQGGSGGAGGYEGNGGNGGASTTSGVDRPGSPGTAGQGGGGGGSAGPYTTGLNYGGPVGLLGKGSNGAGGVWNVDGGKGGPGSNLGGVLCGGGLYAGNLRWLNDIPVTPGEVLTIDLLGKTATDNVYGRNLGVRIMWGNDGRSYPNNAPDTIPKGQLVFTASNTTWTVPEGVTSICACAQQQDGSKAAVSLVVGGTTVLRAQNGNRLGDGGGDGGLSAGGAAGGGGGGGYAGNGGNGQIGSTSPSNGAGGAGAGGRTGYAVWVPDEVVGGTDPSGSYGHWEGVPSQPGGGVGISGQGASGTTPGAQGSPDPINGYMGGGPVGVAGGALAWKNAISVTPGQVININAAGGRVRIIWGPGRSYPSAAGNA